jgi:hypothetical protein
VAPTLPAADDAEEIIKTCVKTVYADSSAMKWQDWLPAHGFSKIKNNDGSDKNEADIHAMDLLDVNIGPYYSELIGKTQTSKKEDMATFIAFIMARLGANMAESYNERQIHVCNQIMTSDRTSMQDDLLESLAVLRMNSKWFLERKDIFQDVLLHLDTGAMDDLSVME